MNTQAVPSIHRLPIHHPEYRYPPSRNPYWIKLQEFQGTVFCDNEGEVNQGKWREKFQAYTTDTATTRPELHVEIGCNGGHVILEWARANPDKRYIGIDWKFKPIHRAAEKAHQLGLKNILFLRGHAERLPYLFAPGEIDTLALYFPDPWPKKAHMKNRFISTPRLKEIAPLIHKTGLFHIKTDHAGYFDWMIEALAGADDLWETRQMTRNLHQDHPAPRMLQLPEVTLFESIFIRRGLPIHSLKITPR